MRAKPGALRVFSFDAQHGLGERVARALGVELGGVELREFEDGEYKIRPTVEVGGCDVYVVDSLHGDRERSPSEKLMRVLFFVGAVRDAGAGRVSVVLPYLCFARKDQRTQVHDPVTTRYVAGLLEAAGVDAVVAVDVHNPAAFDNAFRCRAWRLEAAEVLLGQVVDWVEDGVVSVVSPDVGGIKRAERFRWMLGRALGREIGMGFMEKYRQAGRVSSGALRAQVQGSQVVIVDDLISTGTTLSRAAESARAQGATRVLAAATHGLFVGDAARVLEQSAIERVVVSDTVPTFRLPGRMVGERVRVVGTAELLAGAIRRLHGEV